MKLSLDDAYYAANKFNEFFGDIDRIDSYMRKYKLERVAKMPATLPGLGPETDLFNVQGMHPGDMEFSISEMPAKQYDTYLEIISSHVHQLAIPGKTIFLGVHEKNTRSLVGLIRLGSPTINSKPRNVFLGKPLQTQNPDVMSRFNSSSIMGFVIIPAQPFGYNYLGGKLLAGICCSHAVRRIVNEKYGSNICLFETTSLYGTSKDCSQYDGMRPFLRYVGNTDSNFIPAVGDDIYRPLYHWFVERNGGEHLIPQEATSKKLKRQSIMIRLIKKTLKEDDPFAYRRFCEMIDKAQNLTEKKRTYFGSYGFDNIAEYLNLETDTLTRRDNFDRFELENVYDWWRKKATKRYDKLMGEGRLRTKLETWNTNPDEIEIIR